MKAHGYYYFLRIQSQPLMETLTQVGTVKTFGSGTACSTDDSWCVLQSWASSVSELRKLLNEICLNVEHVEPIHHPSEGVTLSKQTSFLRGLGTP